MKQLKNAIFIQNIFELFLLKYGCTMVFFYTDKKLNFKSPLSSFLVKVNLSRFSTFLQFLKPLIWKELGWLVGVAQCTMCNFGDRREKIGAREGSSRSREGTLAFH